MHPSYLSSQWAREQAREHDLPLIEVQHHHAHIASVMAEAIVAGRLAPDARVLGIAFDGTGAGTDGTIWGGEFLVARLADFERVAHLRAWALPGGAASVHDARRNAFALLRELDLLEHPGAAGLLNSLDEQTRSITATMIERGINSPRTSSMGRLFDAATAIFGHLRPGNLPGRTRHRARSRRLARARQRKAPIFPTTPPAIPHLAHRGWTPPMFWTRKHSLRHFWRELKPERPPTSSRSTSMSPSRAPRHTSPARDPRARGHRHRRPRAACSINRSSSVQLLTRKLESAGLAVLVPRTVPVNDGCIAYGQAAVASARLARIASQ